MSGNKSPSKERTEAAMRPWHRPLLIDARSVGKRALAHEVLTALKKTEKYIFVVNLGASDNDGEIPRARNLFYVQILNEISEFSRLRRDFENRVTLYEDTFVQDIVKAVEKDRLDATDGKIDMIESWRPTILFPSADDGENFEWQDTNYSLGSDTKSTGSLQGMTGKKELTEFEKGILNAVEPQFDELKNELREIDSHLSGAIIDNSGEVIHLKRQFSEHFERTIAHSANLEQQIASLRSEMRESNERLQQEMHQGNEQLRSDNEKLRLEIRAGNEKTNSILEMIAGILQSQNKPASE